ncbi:MAG: type VI secretion system baseplate subunit TssE [Burkholderiaceae bacterium]|nr:type VI secretion system baseplate subunit TssE [Burkholderiaceae bacterium]
MSETASRPTETEHESVARDRLQPVLLDRLTDQQPGKRQERAGAFLMSGKVLRQAVLRDLQWLLNTTNLGVDHAVKAMPRTSRSVINYGVQGWAGARMSEVDFTDVETAIRTAIVNHEPRIMKDSIKVRCVTDAASLEHHNLLALEIRGTLWSVPYPVEFIVRSELDLESGHTTLVPVEGL